MARKERGRIDRGGGNLPVHKVSPDVGGKLGLAAAVLPAQEAKVAPVVGVVVATTTTVDDLLQQMWGRLMAGLDRHDATLVRDHYAVRARGAVARDGGAVEGLE